MRIPSEPWPLRAFLSVYDKTGIVDFARGLVELHFQLVSTGGTAGAFRTAGLPVTDVSEITGFAEMMDGRVKTLHPRVHGGLLAIRDNDKHRAAMYEHGIQPIDLLCVNLYPFEATVAKPGCTFEEAIENIDIGGPAMIRSASKNFKDVVVVTSPQQYAEVIERMRGEDGGLTEEFRRDLAREAFKMTTRYDAAIANYLGGDSASLFPHFLTPTFEKVGEDLRYGENEHQKGALYAEIGSSGPSIARGTVLSGKALSFNNIADLDAALRVVRDFLEPCCVVIKHKNPCGAAIAANLADAWLHAHSGDPTSAFGSVLGFNRVVDAETAALIAVPDNFIECIVAPGFDPEAYKILTTSTKWGKGLRLVRVEGVRGHRDPRDFNMARIFGGALFQEYDDKKSIAESGLNCVSARAPTLAEQQDLEFAWKIAKHVASNAIVLVSGLKIVGVGAGQMSRVDAADIAVKKAGERAKGASVGSDAFFPFADGLEACLRAGCTAAIEPGGSRNDNDVIAAADKAGATLLFTGMRHFRH